ncbi:MAG: succinyl-diaminopimelate desuccinylase [Nitrococcus sp.]|nr:succinyl-diaminopimelate desuccinylase [Nitrococcus sp.]
MSQSATIELTCELIRRRSLSPHDADCQAVLAARLEMLGFRCEHLSFGRVENLWARYGNDQPLLAFVGHTDVVPSGPAADWSTPPFEPSLREGRLYGRGAADMKGSLAAFITACERFLGHHPGALQGSIALLITSDEEGDAIDGTARVVETLRARGEHIDLCLVGEPSSETMSADTIKIGRRGSLHAHLSVRGIQGHVAYPQRARNPIHQFAPALLELAMRTWDNGNASFPPTTMQVSNIHAGTGATNVIPGSLRADVNFRFCTERTAQDIRREVEHTFARHNLDCQIDWRLSAEPFLTEQGPLLEATLAAIVDVTGHAARTSTTGGTSDGRFVARGGAQVIELGPINRTIHQVDEHVDVADLDTISAIYERILERLLA